MKKSAYIKCWIGVFFLFLVQVEAGKQCTTPNNETAECLHLQDCPIIFNALLGLMGKRNKSMEFALQSNTCGGTPRNPVLCCGSSSTFQELETTTKTLNYDLLPDKEYCGLQHSDEYIRPTNAISISEFPWVARIKYKQLFRRDSKVKFMCSGSLINSRYVLTTAHCLLLSRRIVHSVRLGEYHSKNETDCVEEDSLVTECSEPVKDIEVEELVPYPGFNRKGFSNDIGLIRLKENVQYSDYIRPICLPIQGTKLSKVGDILVTSGWGGMKNSDQGEVSIKKKVFSTLITNEECTTAYIEIAPIFAATESHMCSRLLSNNTDLSCNGDSGAPVMTTDGFQWYQEAIVSAGKLDRCAGDVTPEIHTNVTQFIEWIVENIKP